MRANALCLDENRAVLNICYAGSENIDGIDINRHMFLILEVQYIYMSE